MGTSTKRYQWLLFATLVLTLYYHAGYGQSGSFGSTYVHTGGEMAIFGQHNFQNGSGTINAGIIGSERQSVIGLYSFVGPNGSWIKAANNAFVDGYVRTYRSDGFTFPIGDNNVYRPAAVSTAGSASATAATAAYFGVDPGSAVTTDLKGGNYGVLPTGGPFPTSAVATPNLKVDNVEYWDIDGATAARITLTWDARTPINTMTNGVLNTLTIVGWNPATSKWEAIPSVFDATSLVQNTSASSFTGPASTTASGSITTSAAIIPNTYTVYTLAGTASLCPTITNLAANNVNPSTCSGANGSILICGVTAATSYSISYSKNGVVQTGFTQTANASGCLSLTGLTAGTYSAIQVFDATCTAGSNTLGPITLSDPGSPAAPVLTLTPGSGSLCIGQSLTLTASGVAGATFTFAGPGLSAPTGTSVVATLPSVGNAIYTVSQSVAGCTSPVASQTVVVNAQPAISNVVPTNPGSCSGTNGSLALYGLSASTSYTISYSYNGGAAITQTVSTDASGVATLTGLGAGAYTAIIASKNGCSSVAQTATLSDPGSPSAPTVSVSPFSGNLCLGQSVTLTASGAAGATFTFSGPGIASSTGNSVVATPANVGNSIYTVTQSLAGCTSSAASQTVVVNAQPAINSITPTNPSSCSGTNGVLALNGLPPSASYTVSYTYNGVTATQTVVANASGTASLTGLSAGAYTNIIASISGCSSTPQTASLSDPAAPVAPVLTVSSGSGTICQGQSLTLTASGATGATFIFSGPGLGATNGNSVVANPPSVGTAVYTVSQSVSACTSSVASQTVTVSAQPLISSITTANPTACGTPTGGLTLNGLTPSTSYLISYSYNGGTATTSTLTSNASGQVTLSGLAAGAYTNITASNGGGCISSAQTASLSDPSSPTAPTLTANPASPVICLGQSVTLTASGSGTSFTFSGPGLLSTSGSTVTATPTSVGTAIYTVTQSASGCTSPAATYTVTVNAQPVIGSVTPTNPSSCGTNSGIITLNGLTPSLQYTISYSRNGGSPTTGTFTANGSGQVIISGLFAGTYSAISASQGVCASAPYSASITLVDPVPAALTAAQISAFSPNSCGSSTGRIEITGLPANATGIVINYTKNGAATSANVSTDASGKATISNLSAGNYANFSYQIGSCTSAPYTGNVALTDPGLTALTSSNISSNNPTTCGGSDGSITVSGLIANTTMTLSYQRNGVSGSANVTTNGSGQAVLPGLTAGSYSVLTYSIGACTSAPYNGTVSISDPGLTPLTPANVSGKAPSFCGGTNGRIDITGLAANQLVTINYKKDGIAQPAVTAISNGSGQVTIANLGQGVYSDITYSIGTCTSAPYTGSINMLQPELTAPQFTGINPAVCGASNGRIEITGLGSSQSININYSVNGTPIVVAVTTDPTGKALISNLFSGTYTAFSYSQGACTSTIYNGPIILSNPAPTILNASNVLGINPTRCGQADGRIEITGLAGNTSTTINYRQNNIVQVANVTTDASGKAVITGLLAGTYSDFTYTQGTCTSAPYIGPVTLNDPTPTALTAANVTPFNPTSCTASDGRIEITGLASNVTTTLSYTKDGVATTATIVTDNSGKATIANLGTGNYSNFSYSQGTCISAPYTATLAVAAQGCYRISMRVYLQGSLFNNGGGISASGIPLMRDQLRSGGYLPLADPYRTATYTSAFTHVNNAEFQTIPASMTATTGDKAIVDWVFIELRDKSNPAIVSYTRSGLVLRDGTVIDSDGQSSLNFTGFPPDNYYVAVRHRNHLGVMTAQTITIPSSTTVDFITMTDAQLYNTAGYDGVERCVITASGQSVRALWAGNSVHNNKVKYIGNGTDLPGILTNVLSYPGSAGAYNFSNAYGYFIGDINMDGRALYIGAGNDGAFILTNVLTYPLNTAKTYNYDLFFQQLP